jgi:hypothetical protein
MVFLRPNFLGDIKMLCAYMERECTKECKAAIEYDLKAHNYVRPEELRGKFYCERLSGINEALGEIADAIGEKSNGAYEIKEGLQGVQEAIQNIAAMLDLHLEPLKIRVLSTENEKKGKKHGS